MLYIINVQCMIIEYIYLGKDRYNAYHTSISMSFIKKYFFDKQDPNKQPEPKIQ